MTTVHLAATPVEFAMDPTLYSFRGTNPLQVENIEDHNRVEGKIDNSKAHFPFLEHTIDRRVVGNLGSSTDLGVDTLEARTDTGVDLEV